MKTRGLINIYRSLGRSSSLCLLVRFLIILHYTEFGSNVLHVPPGKVIPVYKLTRLHPQGTVFISNAVKTSDLTYQVYTFLVQPLPMDEKMVDLDPFLHCTLYLLKK
jgi:hypothetical protein